MLADQQHDGVLLQKKKNITQPRVPLLTAPVFGQSLVHCVVRFANRHTGPTAASSASLSCLLQTDYLTNRCIPTTVTENTVNQITLDHICVIHKTFQSFVFMCCHSYRVDADR